MNDFDKASLLLTFSERLRYHGSWGGETHIQKAAYFLQDLLRVPLECRFILYKHGPFSFDLRAELTSMRAKDFIVWEPMHPYGPSLRPGPLAEALRLQFPSLPKVFHRQIEFVAQRLGSKRVVELERLGTALYVTLEGSTASADRASRIRELKPHIMVDEAKSSVEELDQICVEARNAGVIWGATNSVACGTA